MTPIRFAYLLAAIVSLGFAVFSVAMFVGYEKAHIRYQHNQSEIKRPPERSRDYGSQQSIFFNPETGAVVIGKDQGLDYDAAWREYREKTDRVYERWESDRNSIHNQIRWVSIAVFLCYLALYIMTVRDRLRTKPRLILGITGISCAVFMLGWSVILSGGISFNEVWLAWVAAAVINCGMLVALSLMRQGSLTVSQSRHPGHIQGLSLDSRA